MTTKLAVHGAEFLPPAHSAHIQQGESPPTPVSPAQARLRGRQKTRCALHSAGAGAHMDTPGQICMHVYIFRFTHMFTHIIQAYVLSWPSEWYRRADFCRRRLALKPGECLDRLPEVVNLSPQKNWLMQSRCSQTGPSRSDPDSSVCRYGCGASGAQG